MVQKTRGQTRLSLVTTEDHGTMIVLLNLC